MIDWSIVATIAGPVLALLAGVAINKAIEDRPKLISYLGHVSAFQLNDEKNTQVNTHSIVVKNTGRKAAKNVRIGHQILPETYDIYPPIEHHINDIQRGGREIVIPVLVSEEQITISYLYYPPITWDKIGGYTKSDEGFAKVITVLPMAQVPRWMVRISLILSIVGFITLLYLLIKMLPKLFSLF